jgi:hypothetical protein
MRRKLCASKNRSFPGAGGSPFERWRRFFVECAGEFHYRRGFL